MRITGWSLIVILVALLSIQFSFATETTVPNLTFNTVEGDLSLKSLNGQVVYLDFWASWCGPCRKSFPWMNKMQARYGKQGFKIIAVNVDRDQSLAKIFLEKYPANFTIAFDPGGLAAKQFEVKGMPSSYLIDRHGHILSSHIGFTEKEAVIMEELIKTSIK